MDGVVNSKGIGIGMVMTSLHGKYEEYRSIKLDFPLSKNQAEYEALLRGMAWALSANIQSLIAYSDSHVVVGQVNNDFTIHSVNLPPLQIMKTQLQREWTGRQTS